MRAYRTNTNTHAPKRKSYTKQNCTHTPNKLHTNTDTQTKTYTQPQIAHKYTRTKKYTQI